MSDPKLEEIKTRLLAATPGRWHRHEDETRAIVSCQRPHVSLLGLSVDDTAIVMNANDAELIAHAPTDIAHLLSRVWDLENSKSALEESVLFLMNYRDELLKRVEVLESARGYIADLESSNQGLLKQRDEWARRFRELEAAYQRETGKLPLIKEPSDG